MSDPRIPDSRATRAKRQAQAEQQVAKALRSGKGVNLYSANPFVAAVETLGTIFTGVKQPTAYAARLKNQEVLKVPGGFNRSSAPQTVNVAGRTFDLAQSDRDAVYIPRTAPGPYGSIVPPKPLSLPDPALNNSEQRAYETEKSRIEQLTAQNPELQRYETARSSAKTQAEMDAARDIGMQIWRQTYQNTPMVQQGGAIGSFNPLMDRTFGYQAGMSPQDLQAMQETAAPVVVGPGEIPYRQGEFGTRATLETGYDPSQYALSPNLVEEMKKRLLQQALK